jgi:hypothetical protein
MKKYTPENIKELAPNQIFVFGSNTKGIHGAGAAKLALNKFGAKYGVGRGLQGQSYALPTKDFDIETLPLYDIERNIKEYLDFAEKNPHLEFLTTLLGCGLAGYKPKQIRPFFTSQKIPENVILPIEFTNEYETQDN